MVGLDPRKGVLAPGAGVIIVDPELQETAGNSFYHCLREVRVYREACEERSRA